MEITIKSDRKDLIDASYALLTEKVIFSAGVKTGFNKYSGNLRDMMKGVLGYNEHRIEVLREGVIIYQEWQTNLGYLGIVKLEGFDEENSEKFKELKKTLESIASTEDIIQLEHDLFPEKFKGESVEEVKRQMKY